jgi:NAD(P)-dependent dehydrogenase (short-subunit alcohol dehydrogenase family)
MILNQKGRTIKLSPLRRFKGKSAVITGGATGVGYAAAQRFAEEGAKVAIIGRRKDVGEEAEKRLQGLGLEVRFIQGDVSDEDSVRSFINQAAEFHGCVDILVNNAAMFYPLRFLGAERKEWRKVFDVILDGAYYCSQEAAQHMVSQGIQGHIINVSSINAYRVLEDSSHYNSAKGALDQLTRCMAMELICQGIRVNGVSLGFIETPMSIIDGENELETDWFQSIYVERKKIPQQRAGQPEEVAGVIAFLASADSSYLCGAMIPVDGGLSNTF